MSYSLPSRAGVNAVLIDRENIISALSEHVNKKDDHAKRKVQTCATPHAAH